jgi:predicted transcriptional regulator
MPTTGEFCSRSVAIAYRWETLRDAAERMRAKHVGCLVVIDDIDGARFPIGMLTDRDIVLGLLATKERTLDSTTVGDVMAEEIVKARESEDLPEALMRMRSFGVRRMPVVAEDGTLQGIVSFDDLVEYVSEEVGDLARLLPREQQLEREKAVHS